MPRTGSGRDLRIGMLQARLPHSGRGIAERHRESRSEGRIVVGGDRLVHTFDRVCGEISGLVNQPLGRCRPEHGVRHYSTLQDLVDDKPFPENDRGSSRQVPELRVPTGSPTSRG